MIGLLGKASSAFSLSIRSLIFFLLLSVSILPFNNATPIHQNTENNELSRRAQSINYTDPNDVGGQMLTIIPNLPDLGEPLNVIVSGLSDSSVLTYEGFLLWATSINFGVSCLGQANGSVQSANLGGGDQVQGTGNGDNGVLRWNYGMPYIGTCKETFEGGNHFRWFKQESSGAFFLAVSVEMDLSTSHMIEQNGYNAGRDQLVGNATLSNGTQWEGNVYNTTVDWIEAGVLENATTQGINHPQIALPNQTAIDGRVALLTVKQLKSGTNGAILSGLMNVPSMLGLVIMTFISALAIMTVL